MGLAEVASLTSRGCSANYLARYEKGRQVSTPDLPGRLGTHPKLAGQNLVLEALGEASGDDGHMDFALICIVNDSTKNHVCTGVSQICDHLRHSVHFL